MDTRMRGVLIFECHSCDTFFSTMIRLNEVYCPKCRALQYDPICDGLTSYNAPSADVAYIAEKEKEFLRAKDIKELLGISLTTVYELFRDKSCPTIRLGGVLLVDKQKFYNWLEAREQR